MIEEIVVGDITSFENHSDIIIGMNSTIEDVSGIGLPYTRNISTIQPIELGTVLTFDFDGRRKVHMIVCHNIGFGGWTDADKHIRFGMDYLWKKSIVDGIQGKPFSIVQIGAGEIGKRDGADVASIRTAMANSYLSVRLFVLDYKRESVRPRVHAQLKAISAWGALYGEESLVQK